MKKESYPEVQDCGSSESVYAFYQFIGVVRSDRAETERDENAPYRCRNCGKRMRLAEAANFYGIPACPVCLSVGAPFEILPESPNQVPPDTAADSSGS